MVLALACVPAAFAQSGVYVSAGADANVFRRDHASSAGFSSTSGEGETFGGSLRLGSTLGERWGIEVEYTRSGELEIDQSFSPFATDPRALITGSVSTGSVGAGTSPGTGGGTGVGTGGVLPDLPTSLVLPYDYHLQSERQQSSVNAALWWQQPAGARATLNYVAGIAFVRDVNETTTSITPLVRTNLPIRIAPQSYTSVNYSVGPMAGFEARIKLTDHVRLVPGIRLQGLDDGLLVRANVSLGWWF